jgi:hypothetical protein
MNTMWRNNRVGGRGGRGPTEERSCDHARVTKGIAVLELGPNAI